MIFEYELNSPYKYHMHMYCMYCLISLLSYLGEKILCFTHLYVIYAKFHAQKVFAGLKFPYEFNYLHTFFSKYYRKTMFFKKEWKNRKSL